VAAAAESIKQPDRSKHRWALEWLLKAKPINPERAAIANALDPILIELNDRSAAGVDPLPLKVAVIWADKINISSLSNILRDRRRAPSHAVVLAIQALGKQPDDRAVRAIAELLGDPTYAAEAKRTLEEMGPIAIAGTTK